jgi:hypothetical protein
MLKGFPFYEPYFQVVFTLELEKQTPKSINFESCKVSPFDENSYFVLSSLFLDPESDLQSPLNYEYL